MGDGGGDGGAGASAIQMSNLSGELGLFVSPSPLLRSQLLVPSKLWPHAIEVSSSPSHIIPIVMLGLLHWMGAMIVSPKSAGHSQVSTWRMHFPLQITSQLKGALGGCGGGGEGGGGSRGPWNWGENGGIGGQCGGVGDGTV